MFSFVSSSLLCCLLCLPPWSLLFSVLLGTFGIHLVHGFWILPLWSLFDLDWYSGFGPHLCQGSVSPCLSLGASKTFWFLNWTFGMGPLKIKMNLPATNHHGCQSTKLFIINHYLTQDKLPTFNIFTTYDVAPQSHKRTMKISKSA